MKHKNLFLKIYIPFVIITIIALIVLQILGSKKRIGYLTDFNLNIERTLALNNLKNINKSFTIDRELDEESIKNYLLTNESITNYVYQFRIRYYDKTFRNSDIYGVYVDLSNLPDYMENAEMEEGGSPYGNFISDSKIIETENIDINYILKIKPKIPTLLYFILALRLIIYLYNANYEFIINTNLFKKYDNFFTDKRFIILIIFIGVILFIFQFWLCFPGYYNYPDAYAIFEEAITNRYTNWHPIIIGLTLHILFNIFGYHTFYIFFINLFLWYGGLTLIIISLYLRFKNRLLILLLLISFIGNIFFMNINHLKDTTSSLFVWFAYSIIFFQILTNNKKLISQIILNSLCLVSLIFGLLWRHNMIVTIYPIFIFYSLMIINKIGIKNIKTKILSFILSMGVFAILLILIVKLFPLIFSTNNQTKNISSLIPYFSVIEIAYLTNDEYIIPDNWYLKDKTFQDFKDLHKKYTVPMIDYYILDLPMSEAVFTHDMNIISVNVKTVFIKTILKYPFYYIKHLFRLGYYFFNTKVFKFDEYQITKNDLQYDFSEYCKIFLNKGISFNKVRLQIYKYLFENIFDINIFIFAILSTLIFIITLLWYLFKPYLINSLLIFTFSTAFSSVSTYLIVIFTTIGVHYRYMHPIVPTSIIALISFITFIYDSGGFKKFIKELRGNKK